MRLRRHFDHDDSTGIDLAPMLDFVLNLLIFFIITAVFVRGRLPVGRHGGGAGGPATGKGTGSISVVVKETGDVLVDNRRGARGARQHRAPARAEARLGRDGDREQTPRPECSCG